MTRVRAENIFVGRTKVLKLLISDGAMTKLMIAEKLNMTEKKVEHIVLYLRKIKIVEDFLKNGRRCRAYNWYRIKEGLADKVEEILRLDAMNNVKPDIMSAEETTKVCKSSLDELFTIVKDWIINTRNNKVLYG